MPRPVRRVSPAPATPVFTQIAPAREVARLSSDLGSSLILFDDCSWRMEAEEAPRLGHGKFRAAMGELILDDDLRLSPRRHRRPRPYDTSAIGAPLYDEEDIGWRWDGGAARIPQRCELRR